MDLNQVARLVQYLDEERRKDRALIVQLTERVEGLSREVESRSRYAQSLESSLNDLKVQLPKSMGWTTAVEQVRAEFGQIVERIEDQRNKTERDGVRVRQIEIESIMRQLNELKREVKPYNRYADEIEARKVEEGRLSELISRAQLQVMDLERRFDSPTAQISYLEEQRRQDNKRLVAMEQELPELTKKLDQFPPKLLLLDEAVRRKNTEIEEAAKVLEAQSQVLESQRVSDVRRERQFAEYAETVEKLKNRADEIAAQVTGFIQMREEVRRVIAEVPDIAARLEVRVNEIAEIQREAEDRAKRVADEFRESIMKELRTFTVSQDEKWFPRDKRIADYEPRLNTVEEEISKFQPQINPLYDILEAFTKSYVQAGREWLSQATGMFEKAKINLPSEYNSSRRQLRKKKDAIASEMQHANNGKAVQLGATPGGETAEARATQDEDLDDLLNDGLVS